VKSTGWLKGLQVTVGGFLPVRQLRVIVRIDRRHAAARQLPSKRRISLVQRSP